MTNRGLFGTTLIPLGTVTGGEKYHQEVVMAEEIKVGDWISYRMSGLAGRSKVVGFDGEPYTVQHDGWSGGQVTVVGKKVVRVGERVAG